jgi:hypothetical protein
MITSSRSAARTAASHRCGQITDKEDEVPPITRGQTVATASTTHSSLTVSRGRRQSLHFQKTPTILHSTRTAAQARALADSLRCGQGATLNFSDLCLGLSPSAVKPMALRNFMFAWPDIETGAVATSPRWRGSDHRVYLERQARAATRRAIAKDDRRLMGPLAGWLIRI